MDEVGKNKAIQALEKVNCRGATNLWDGLKMSIEEIKTNIPPTTEANVFALVLTDGEPNINPVRGVFNEFKSEYDNLTIKSTFNFFG